MKFYISGPMSGYVGGNFAAFDAACAEVRGKGHVAIGPQELDRACGGSVPEGNCLPSSEEMRRYLLRDLVIILTEAEGIVVLDGWEKSRGAKAEVALAMAVGIPVYDQHLNPLHVRVYAERTEL
jgi:hypothetical protein